MRSCSLCVCVSFSLLLGSAVAQDKSSTRSSTGNRSQTPYRKGTPEARGEAPKELKTPYRKWLNEDVAYIITDEERAAFKRLQTDEEREQFIEQFWLRRDPTPDTLENEYKEEHYRRIAYANERYASGIPGWKTDRGRIYITFGPAGRKRIASLRRHLSAASGRGRRHDVDIPVREMALSLDRGHRHRHHHRVRRSHHDRRVPHDHGPVREGRAADGSRTPASP